MSRVRYAIGRGEDPSDGYTLSSCISTDNDGSLAEECAGHFHNRGGYESEWPLVIVIQVDDGEVIEWEVAREVCPVFEATRLGVQAGRSYQGHTSQVQGWTGPLRNVQHLSYDDIRQIYRKTSEGYRTFTDDAERHVRSTLQAALSCQETGEDGFRAAVTSWVGPVGNLSPSTFSVLCEDVHTMLELAGIKFPAFEGRESQS